MKNMNHLIRQHVKTCGAYISTDPRALAEFIRSWRRTAQTKSARAVKNRMDHQVSNMRLDASEVLIGLKHYPFEDSESEERRDERDIAEYVGDR